MAGDNCFLFCLWTENALRHVIERIHAVKFLTNVLKQTNLTQNQGWFSDRAEHAFSGFCATNMACGWIYGVRPSILSEGILLCVCDLSVFV